MDTVTDTVTDTDKGKDTDREIGKHTGIGFDTRKDYRNQDSKQAD